MIEQKIGFDRVRGLVAEECTNAFAAQMARDMEFSDDYQRVVRHLQQTDEMRRVVLFHSEFPSQDFIDLSDALSPLRIDNTAIQQPDLFNLKCSLRTIASCLRFLLPDVYRFNKIGEVLINQESLASVAAAPQAQHDDPDNPFPQLRLLAQHVCFNPKLLKEADRIVDDRGEIYDNATPALLDIRRQMQRKRASVDTCLSRALNHAKQEGWAPDGAEVTIRNGRMVIPMLDTHRRKIKGLIHDESATRQTAYLEPADVVELNNDLRELEFAERHEIQHILMHFSDLLRPELDNLLAAYWFLARLDFLRAKARVALSMNAEMPIVNNDTMVRWYEACHPLLYLQRQADGGRGHEVVPFDIDLDARQRILIVSGPNAGGKSVCLKAVGLIQYMLQCGMLVPCRPTSEFGIFESIFIDIGDGQSVDNDLSTYSSHLVNMRQLLATAGGRTLFLLDELGSGTEPRSGCAIAEAMLEELDSRGAYGVATTHYADLKLLADTHEHIVNGAMLFDTEHLRPLYRLSIGHPGSSFAFEIAQSVGFPRALLEAAEKKVGSAMLNFEHQLQQLELDKREVAQQKAVLDANDKLLAEVLEKYQTLNSQLQQQRRELISQARQEARQIVADANRAVERTISEIRTAQAERAETQRLRQELQQHAQQLEADEQRDQAATAAAGVQPKYAAGKQKQKNKNTSSAGEVKSDGGCDVVDMPIKVGTIVRIDGDEVYGEITAIKGKRATVMGNSISMTIELSRLQATSKQHIPTKPRSQSSIYHSVMSEINEKRKHFNPTLDLRGQRADEAQAAVMHFIDEAQLLSEHEVRLLHGNGNGILKQMLRQWLLSSPDVASFRPERHELGGDGITVVTLK